MLRSHRYFQLAVFFVLQVCRDAPASHPLMQVNAAIAWACFPPISVLVNQIFASIGPSPSDWFTNVFYIAFLPGMVLASWLLDFATLRAALLSGTFVLAVGAWVRYVGALVEFVWRGPIALSYAVVMLGQVVSAVAQPIILNASEPTPSTLTPTPDLPASPSRGFPPMSASWPQPSAPSG
jgi:hypothetical protein